MPPVNSSLTGGYLQPAASPAPLEGQALYQFVQQWVVGVTGMDGSVVRPRWQSEPPNIPAQFTCWAALGVTSRPSDEYPYSDWNQSLLAFQLQRHEELATLISFYDTGVTGEADYYAALFRDGAAVAQNREVLVEAGMNVVRVGSLVTVSSLFKQRWLYRVDLDLSLRREIDRLYPVETLVAAKGDVYTDGGLAPQPFAATDGG